MLGKMPYRGKEDHVKKLRRICEKTDRWRGFIVR
jgi:hypothetical protein